MKEEEFENIKKIQKYITDNYISKDKIRKIIETSTYSDFAIQKILELLRESESNDI